MKKVLSVLMAALMAVSLCALAACEIIGDGKDPVKYTVTYDANGGEGTPPAVESYEEGAIVTVKLATTFTRTGYAFKTWNDGTNDYAAGATFKMPAKNVTLKAQWEEVIPQLYGVWSFTQSREYEGQLATVSYEFTITESDEESGFHEADFYVTVVASNTTKKSDGTSQTQHMMLYTYATEDANTPGTYTLDRVRGLSLAWSEVNKTLTIIAPASSTGEAEEYPMTYAPLPANVNLDGDYWTKSEDDEVTTLKIVGKRAGIEGKMRGYYDLVYTGKYVVATERGSMEYLLEKTENGLRAYTSRGDSYEFKKGTPPTSSSTAE